MSHFGSRTEHGLHCLTWISGHPANAPLSSGDLADFLGLSASFVRKLLTQLENAGLISSSPGRSGGYTLARPASEITVLDAVDALEPRKQLFNCKEIRRHCILFKEKLPRWAQVGPCEINAVFVQAEEVMRAELANHSLEDLSQRVSAKAPAQFGTAALRWFERRSLHKGVTPDV